MEREWRGRPPLVWLLIGLLGVLGVRGFVGGGQFLLVPSGEIVGVSTRVLQPTPVSDFFVPGLFLFFALGIAPIAVAYYCARRVRWAPEAVVAVGSVVTGWAVLEGIVLGFGERLQALNLLYGVVLIGLALTPPVRGYFGETDQ